MTEEQWDLIVRDPTICHGQATIRGTRVMVSVILDNLARDVDLNDLIGCVAVSRDGKLRVRRPPA